MGVSVPYARVLFAVNVAVAPFQCSLINFRAQVRCAPVDVTSMLWLASTVAAPAKPPTRHSFVCPIKQVSPVFFGFLFFRGNHTDDDDGVPTTPNPSPIAPPPRVVGDGYSRFRFAPRFGFSIFKSYLPTPVLPFSLTILRSVVRIGLECRQARSVLMHPSAKVWTLIVTVGICGVVRLHCARCK